jgi:hypothetical protein
MYRISPQSPSHYESSPAREEIKWNWSSEQQDAFEKLKQSLIRAEVMSYYNQNAETNIIVDAIPYGLGAILSQKQKKW